MRGAQAVPFFATTATPAQDRTRLLLISYHFPPSQSAGALRWQKLARHAAERSWGVDVLTLDPASLRDADPRRLDDLPGGVRVYGIPAVELRIDRIENIVWRWWRRRLARPAANGGRGTAGSPTRARTGSFALREVRWRPRSLRDVLRAYYALLDHWRGQRWATQAASLAFDLIQPGVHRAIISCGPPHMVHDAARRVAKRTGVPFVMDLRDPWSFAQRLPEAIAHPLWWWLAARHERRAIPQAALVVANTERVRQELARRYPGHRDRCLSVMNGFDDEPIPNGTHRDRFVIGYAGSIYLDRDPRPLFRAAARVIREYHLSPAELGIELIGTVKSYEGVSINAMAREEGIEEYVTAGPPLPRHEAMAFLARATMLVSLPQDSDMAIPSKVFEYMRFAAWLLALAEPESATGLLLDGTDADVVPPHDVDAITAVLRRRYLEHSAGIHPEPIARDTRFSRASQAKVLFDAIEVCTGRPSAIPAPTVRADPLSGAQV